MVNETRKHRTIEHGPVSGHALRVCVRHTGECLREFTEYQRSGNSCWLKWAASSYRLAVKWQALAATSPHTAEGREREDFIRRFCG